MEITLLIILKKGRNQEPLKKEPKKGTYILQKYL